MKNQPRIYEYFKSDKPRLDKPYKKQEPAPKYNIETILASLRGDKVRILWLPKLHYELDPSKYVAVFLLNEISQRLDREEAVEGEEAKTLKDLCAEGVDVLPSGIWTKIVELVDDISAGYLQDENRDDNEQDETEDNEQDDGEDNEQDETGDSKQDESATNESDSNTANEQDITVNDQQEEITVKCEPFDE